MIKVSVIIPVYRSAQYVEQCVQSVMSQTFRGELECILVDDCGNDGSIEAVERSISAYHGRFEFRVLKHERNRGAAAARNTGLDAATGDYIYYMDSDDWILPTCIEDLVSMLTFYPQADMVHAGIKTTDGSIPWFDFEVNPFPEYVDDFYEIKVNLLGREEIPASPVNKLIPRKFLLEHSLYFHEGIVIEDVLWCNILAKYVKSIACLNKNTYIYRIRQGSVVTSGLGVDPLRKLIVYKLMIDAVDKPYVKEQVEHLIYQLDKVYFENENIEIRKRIGLLLRKLSSHCSFRQRAPMLLKSFFAYTDSGNKSISYYLYYQTTSESSIVDVLSKVIRKLLHL